MPPKGGKVGQDATLPLDTHRNENQAVSSGNLIDDVFEMLMNGKSASSGTVGRREFICQEGRIYARIRLGSGKKRTKENGGYFYKGHISKYEKDPRWEKRIGEYATSHKCHYPHPDLAGSRSKPSDVGDGLSRPSGSGREMAHVTIPIEVWESRPNDISLPS